MVCEHVDNFRQLRTWLTVRVTLDSICNTCNVFFLFLKSDLLTLAQQTPEEQPRHGTNIIYNFLQILMLKNTNSPEGRLSKDLQKTWPSINFFSNLILGLLEISESVWNLNLSSNPIEVPDSYRFKGYHYQQLGCSKYLTMSFFKCITTRRDGGLRKFESECWESFIFCKSWKPSLLYKLECAHIDKMTTNHLFTKL